MKFTSSVLYAIASVLCSAASVDAGCQYVGGNYYCNSVSAINYQGVGFSGSYQDVTNMDESSCACTQENYAFSGTLAPLDEELSVHFRGPIQLKQFGVYYPSGSSVQKRDVADSSEDCTTTKHVHHQHKRAPVVEYAYVTETVFKDANGNVITSSQSADVATDATSAAAAETALVQASGSSTTTLDAAAASTDAASSSTQTTSSSSAAAASSSAASSSSGSSTGAWTRSSYFTPGSADNCVFMNHQGGNGSGVWSSCFGNSISFASSDGVSGSSSAQALGDVTIASNKEFMIFSGSECSGSECGYYRSDIPAYQGFSGANKIFVFEFQMPTATDSASYNYDMPAIWLLNAKIPRTLQYGNADCSCWSTGCGEFDVFEILSSGSDKLISHLHDGQGSSSQTAQAGGGSSDYFTRPVDSTMKAAVIFTDGNIQIVVLDDSTTFDSALSESTVSSWLSVDASVATLL